MEHLPVSLEDVQAAAERVKAFAYRTPIYFSDAWSSITGAEAYLKLECYQPIRAFKIRGAANKLVQLNPNERKLGVVAASSGNHGLAVAYVAKRLGIPAKIVVPTTAVSAKVEAIEEQGATVFPSGTLGRQRIEKALKIAEETGAVFIHSFDDLDVIAGQGTVGLEIVQDLPEVDSVVVPVGGGGLISGIAVAVKSTKPSVRVVGVQAEGAASMYESIRQDKPVVLDRVDTIADGLSPGEAGRYTFEIARKLVDSIILVSDNEIRDATMSLLDKSHVLAEPSGAAGLAAAKKLGLRQGEKVVFVVSGGNISRKVLQGLICSQ
ncbi:threonine/serine dehydratase [Candidatus Bathyarchaeota archaeon]|nr:threonine/serine dehydratase [Candidatus Bathyarchaeota archaeon]